MKRVLAALAISAGLAAASGAHAANYILNLSGSAFDVMTNSFTFDGKDYDTGFLELSGFTPFTLQDGDTVDVTVDITSGPAFPFVVPLGGEMFFGLNFSDISGGAEPIDAQAHGFFSFDGSTPVEVGCSNCTSFIHGRSNDPLAFTTLAATGAFTLGADYEIKSITVSYQVSNPTAAPEPGAWALMIVGFGAAGAMVRRRRGALTAA